MHVDRVPLKRITTVPYLWCEKWKQPWRTEVQLVKQLHVENQDSRPQTPSHSFNGPVFL